MNTAAIAQESMFGEARSLALLAMDYPPSVGGIQTLTTEIYGRLGDLTQAIVAPAAPGAADVPGPAPLLRTAHEAGQGLETLRFLREAIVHVRALTPQPRLLHCNHLFAGYAGWWLRQRYGIPYVVWVHGEELTKSRYRRLNRASLSHASALLTNSDFSAAIADEVIGRDRGKRAPEIVKIPLGAPTAWWQSPVSERAHTGPPLILTVARLCRRDRYKGLDVALQAMRELKRRGLEFRYRIAGDGDDRTELEALAADLPVEFLGRVPDSALMGLYDDCDVFLLCSREQMTPRGLGFEGFGIVYLEANARGRAVVGGRSGGIPDAIVDGETGVLVDPNSPAAVADSLEKLLRDPVTRTRMGAAGRARVEREYNWDEAARRVRTLHLRLLEQRG